MKAHFLKTHPVPFAALQSGSKKHEVRVNDRNFQESDQLILEEWDPSAEQYTGRVEHRWVTYVTPGGTWGLPDKICVMSVEPVLDDALMVHRWREPA